MSGFDQPLLQVTHVDLVNSIDELPVPLVIWIEVVTEAAIDKHIDDITEGDEDIESEALYK